MHLHVQEMGFGSREMRTHWSLTAKAPLVAGVGSHFVFSRSTSLSAPALTKGSFPANTAYPSLLRSASWCDPLLCWNLTHCQCWNKAFCIWGPRMEHLPPVSWVNGRELQFLLKLSPDLYLEPPLGSWREAGEGLCTEEIQKQRGRSC